MKWLITLFAIMGMQATYASITIPMYLVAAKGQGKSIGTVKAEEGPCGIVLTPNLHDLTPGLHGFTSMKIHRDNGAMAAEDFDPAPQRCTRALIMPGI